MSDDEEFDFSQGLKLKNPSNSALEINVEPVDFKPFELSSEQEKEIDDWFGGGSGDKWEASVKAKEQQVAPENSVFRRAHKGFGMETEDSEEEDELTKSGKLDWDASRIFLNMAAEESGNENSICVLRLHDILTKCELGIQQISRQMINCGRSIAESSPQQRHELGFTSSVNQERLLDLIKSVRTNSKLMRIELDALADMLTPSFVEAPVQKSVKFLTSSRVIWSVVTIGAIVGTTYVAYQRYVTTRNILWVAYKVAV